MKISPQVAMTLRQIMLMNFGFFGIQYSFGLQQTAINPIFSFLHADPSQLPILNMAGPITGLLVQPMIGAMSDRTWVPGLGRRRPYFLIGAIGCSLCLFIYPHVTALWVAYCCCGSWTSATTRQWNLSVPLLPIPFLNNSNPPVS